MPATGRRPAIVHAGKMPALPGRRRRNDDGASRCPGPSRFSSVKMKHGILIGPVLRQRLAVRLRVVNRGAREMGSAHRKASRTGGPVMDGCGSRTTVSRRCSCPKCHARAAKRGGRMRRDRTARHGPGARHAQENGPMCRRAVTAARRGAVARPSCGRGTRCMASDRHPNQFIHTGPRPRRCRPGPDRESRPGLAPPSTARTANPARRMTRRRRRPTAPAASSGLRARRRPGRRPGRGARPRRCAARLIVDDYVIEKITIFLQYVGLTQS